MATRKQKRAAAQSKREKWEEEQRVSGLRAQEEDHKVRDSKERDAWRTKHNKEHSWKVINEHCILCRDILDRARSVGNG